MVLGACTLSDFSDCARRGGRLFTTGRKEFYIFITPKTIFRARLAETSRLKHRGYVVTGL